MASCFGFIGFFVFFFFVSLSQAQSGESHFELYKLPAEYVRDSAVCNDGSPGAFYFSPSPSQPTRWIIHLQGGYWCWDGPSCQQRAIDTPDYVSSNGYSSSLTLSSGLFSRDPTKNPDWANASYVYIMYCSSDQYAGDGVNYVGSSSKNGNLIIGDNWQFRGKEIVLSIVQYLFGFNNGLKYAQEILWSGCSAGGQGVVNTVDEVSHVLLQNGFQGKLKALADAGWMSQFQPSNNNIPMGEQLQQGHQLWNGTSTDCTRSNPGFEGLCYLSQFAYPHLHTPVLFQTEQYDQFQTSYDCCNPPFVGGNEVYVEGMRTAYQFSFGVVEKPFGIFSAACYWHCSSEDTTFNDIQINFGNFGNLSLQQVLGNFYFEREGPTQVVDHCDGYDCSIGCPE